MPSEVPNMLHICDLLYNIWSDVVQQVHHTSLILVIILYKEAYSLITFTLFSGKISSRIWKLISHEIPSQIHNKTVPYDVNKNPDLLSKVPV